MAEQANGSGGNPLTELHADLVGAASRATRPAGRRRSAVAGGILVTAIAVCASVALAVSLAADDGSAAADVTVQKSGGRVTVSIDPPVTVEEIERKLEAAGVRVTVRQRATGPSLVDQFVGIIGPPDAVLTGGDGTNGNLATFREGSSVELHLGVAAREGQLYDASPDATRSGEPFEGLALSGRRLADVRDQVERRATERGVTIDYRDATGQPTETPDPDGIIGAAMAASSDRVMVLVT